MQPILMIVESPNKSKKIDEMFGGRFKAMATYGHICDLPASPQDASIGIDRESMKGLYELTSDKTRHVDGKRVVAKIQEYRKRNPGSEIYLATDNDREGESISAFVMKYLKLPPTTKRMRFNSITKEKIQAAFESAGLISWADVSAREARRLTDRVIGYPGSKFLQEAVGKRKGVAAGRVQTAVEALVVERERKIRGHQPQTFYTVHFDLGGWVADWRVQDRTPKRTGPKPNSEFDIDDSTARCFDAAIADEIARLRTLSVNECADTFESRPPPSPLYTISMIQLANRVLGWDADLTMQVAQKLFEGDGSGHGHITYHRTDSPNIEPEAAEEIRAWLREQGLPIPAEPNTWKSKNKQAQEGHEAIRPTYLTVEEAGATDEQKALYKLIRERAIYSQLAPARYSVKRIVLTDIVRAQEEFTATARALVDPGWLRTAAAKSPTMQYEDEEEEIPTLALPNLVRGALINVKGSEIRKHVTKAPPRYTMNSLTSKLERLCIGRPATIASLLKNVQTKGTIALTKDKKLEATPLAEQCYDVLYPRFQFAHIGYTADLEQALDQIALGKIDGQALVRSVWDRLDADIAAAKASRG